MNSRNAVITELEKQAKSILELKDRRGKKRPIVIEFSGSPKSGKTSCINSLELFLKRNGFTVKTVQERASICPVSDKQSPMFNIWTACMSLAGMLGTLENKHNNIDVLILDRGIFDALCWFNWLVKKGKMEKLQQEKMESFLLMEELVKPIDIVFAFVTEPEISIEREYTNLLTDKLGTIMNPAVLKEYREALEETIENKRMSFHYIKQIDTSNKEQNEVGKEVTEYTLKTLRELLMERIGHFEKTRLLTLLANKKSFFEYEEIKEYLGKIVFEMRDDVENNYRYIQPIPIAIITNNSRDRILAIKKQPKAVSPNSPEKDKLLIYVGGHTRYEDTLETTAPDFLMTCRSTLKREVKEEIGISVALDGITPKFIYDISVDESKKHMAVCFVVEQDLEELKLQIDTDELVSRKGKSKSGTFYTIEELADEKDSLENWSQIILKEIFGMDLSEVGQRTIFE